MLRVPPAPGPASARAAPCPCPPGEPCPLKPQHPQPASTEVFGCTQDPFPVLSAGRGAGSVAAACEQPGKLPIVSRNEKKKKKCLCL